MDMKHLSFNNFMWEQRTSYTQDTKLLKKMVTWHNSQLQNLAVIIPKNKKIHFRMLGLTNLWKISDEKLESTVSALFKGQTQSLHISSRGCQTIHWAWKSRSFLIRTSKGGFSRHKILETSLKQPKQSHQQKAHSVLMNSQ